MSDLSDHLRDAAMHEAERLGHREIGVEHLLLVLIASDGVPAQAFVRCGAKPEQVRHAVPYAPPDASSPAGMFTYRPGLHEALDAGRDRAKRLGQTAGPGHVLLALVEREVGVLVLTLEHLGMEAEGNAPMPLSGALRNALPGSVMPDEDYSRSGNLSRQRSWGQRIGRYPGMQCLDDMGEIGPWLHAAQAAALHDGEL